MPIPDEDLTRIEAWVNARNREIGEHIDKMRVEMDVRRNHVTIFEDSFLVDTWIRVHVARLRFERSVGWSLYWSDSDGNFHEYDLVEWTDNVKRLLDEIDRDPTFIFWG